MKAVIPSSVLLLTRSEYKQRQDVVLEQACMEAIQARKQSQQDGFLDGADPALTAGADNARV
jgi:hypothetical protein